MVRHMSVESFSKLFVCDKGKAVRPIYALTPQDFDDWKAEQAGPHLAWVETTHFTAAAGSMLILPDEAGGLSAVLLGLGNQPDPFALAALPKDLPHGIYRLARGAPAAVAQMAALAWALGTYQFDRYKSKNSKKEWPQLVCATQQDIEMAARLAHATCLVRDLINTPAADMTPTHLQEAAENIAQAHGAEISTLIDEDLLAQNFPMIHAVGRAAAQNPAHAPRLIDMCWGRVDAPRLTLVGKGVCFDTGGLNLKPGNYMDLMKKDMGGAAIALALGEAVMLAGLDVRLRVLIGAVENAIGPEAFRPGDILPSRKGLNVEIGNTDAEGRLILADMLALADEEKPDLLFDFATLTGAARVALGPEIVPFYTHDETLASALHMAAQQVHDPLWRMPLWAHYDNWLDSKIADVNHIAASPMAGSMTAALFLSRFVTASSAWVHFDVYGWRLHAHAACPVGGEAQALRAALHLLEARYGG